jgi:hypothetical protein
MAIATTTTLNDLIRTEAINQTVLEAARARTFLPTLVWNRDATGLGSKTMNFPRWAAATAAAVAENGDLGQTALSTDQAAALTVSEVGINLPVSRLAQKVNPGQIDLNALGRQAGFAVADKMETDIAATFANAGSSVGVSGADLTLDDIDDAIYALDAANAPIGNPGDSTLPPSLVQVQCVLHTIQMKDLRKALRVADLAFIPPEQMAIVNAAGMTPGGLTGEYLSVTFWRTTVVATANAGADRCGAMFVPAGIGLLTLGPPETDFDKDGSARVTEVIVTATYGTGVVATDYVVKIVTDA